MSADLSQCPGCGRLGTCACTPETIRAQLATDRATLSDRVAAFTARSMDEAVAIARVHAENEQLRAMLRWAASGEPMTEEIRRSIREALHEEEP